MTRRSEFTERCMANGSYGQLVCYKCGLFFWRHPMRCFVVGIICVLGAQNVRVRMQYVYLAQIACLCAQDICTLGSNVSVHEMFAKVGLMLPPNLVVPAPSACHLR